VSDASIQELTRTQQTVARRTAESKATVPDFTLQAEIDMEACAALREERERTAGGSTDPVPSLLDMVVKACALALREHPRANSRYKDGRFELLDRVHVGVSMPAHGTVVAPTVFDADRKSLAEIARDTQTLAERVRSKTITQPELSGATFTVAALESETVTAFTAIVQPPQAAALAVGATVARAVVREGQVVARRVATATLTCDHRILYGAEAAAFLTRVRELLERPGDLPA
jgi:pyruvate dehydrogenase E2 component (dihydrolipoamide acetyltransferase)